MADVFTSSIMTWFSRLKQASYATADKIAAAGNWRRLGETNKVLFDVVPNFVASTENNGSDEATDYFITTNQFREDALETFFTFQDLPYFLQMIMGVIASSGSAVPYSHIASALNKNTSRSHPVRTWGQRKGTDILIYPSVGLREVRIAKDATGKLKVTITPHGKGVVLENPASYTVPAAVADRVFGWNNQVSHVINDIVSELTKTYQCTIESWEWVFTNNELGDGYRDCSEEFETGNPNAGQVKAEHLTGAYDWKFNFTTRLQTDDPARQIMRKGDRLTVTTTITSTEKMADVGATPFSAVGTDPNAKIMSLSDTPQDNGFILRSVNCQLLPNKTTGLMDTSWTIVNDTPSYTV